MALNRPAQFGVHEFQLVLLRRMADYQPELVEKARGELGAGPTEMREANAQWQRMTRSQSFRLGIPALRGILGTPVAEGPRRLGDLVCPIAQWKLPLWPELRFEAMAAPGGALLSQMLVRDPGSAAPTLRGLDDLTPWSCVIGDVERAFSPVRHHEGSAPSRWTVTFTEPAGRADDADGTNGAESTDAAVGAGRTVIADFVWGLIQTARLLPL